jgi:transposase-like protein
MGRRPGGVEQVSRLAGDAEAKRRLRVVLETLSGERTIEEACAELSVSESRFHELRRAALEAALEGLAPGASGRPKREAPAPDPGRLAELERQNEELRFELQGSLVRTELALAMPHVLTAKARAEIKKKARAARRLLRGRSDANGSDT